MSRKDEVDYKLRIHCTNLALLTMAVSSSPVTCFMGENGLSPGAFTEAWGEAERAPSVIPGGSVKDDSSASTSNSTRRFFNGAGAEKEKKKDRLMICAVHLLRQCPGQRMQNYDKSYLVNFQSRSPQRC